MFPTAMIPSGQLPVAVYAVDIGIALMFLWAIMLFVYHTRRAEAMRSEAFLAERAAPADDDDYTIKVDLLQAA